MRFLRGASQAEGAAQAVATSVRTRQPSSPYCTLPGLTRDVKLVSMGRVNNQFRSS